jgi:hypothetical protein
MLASSLNKQLQQIYCGNTRPSSRLQIIETSLSMLAQKTLLQTIRYSQYTT